LCIVYHISWYTRQSQNVIVALQYMPVRIWLTLFLPRTANMPVLHMKRIEKWPPHHYTGWARKNVALHFRPYLYQLLIDFQNSFTGTLSRQFAIMWLLHIPPHSKCVSTLPCEISMKYAYITIITNILVKSKKRLDEHCSEWSVWH